MIEVKELLEDFEIIDVQTLSTDYGINDDRASIAVSLYNKALNKMNIGSYDSARIDLRKSVNMYPSFVESRMLLGVCVFALGDRTDAVGVFNSIKGDNRERALNYLDRLHELSTRPESASFKSVSRQSRVPDAVYSGESKLDEVMNSSAKKNPESDEAEIETLDEISTDSEIVETDVTESDEKFVETSIDYVKNIVLNENEKDNTEVESYSSIRSQNRHRYRNVTEGRDVETLRENVREKDTAVQKKRNIDAETLARAKRTISNLTIKNARITILAMGIGLCALILLIVVICLSVSNANLKKDNKALSEKIAVFETSMNSNSGDVSENQDSQQDGSSENNDANSQEDIAELQAKAKTAFEKAKTLCDSDKHAEAADLLADTDLSYLDYDKKSEADALYKSAVEKFTNTYFNYMYLNVSKEAWSSVIDYGLPVYKHNVEHLNPAFTNGAALCFNLGKAYEFSGDKEKAKEFYQTTINLYPTSSDAGYAQYRMSMIE